MSQNIILESLYKVLINEAKTPEQVLEILSNRFISNNVKQQDPQYYSYVKDIISKLMSIDPTKKYSYSQWATSLSNDISDIEIGLDNGDFKKIFDFAIANHDYQIQTYRSREDALNGIEIYLGKSAYNVVFENDKWIIYVPETYEAERYIAYHLYGGADWCTASSNGRGYFRQYNENGNKLYIIANKQNKKIYQYSPKTHEFHDSNNCQVSDPPSLVGGEVTEWFSEQNMNIENNEFPGEDDIYNGGTYGLKFVGGVYSKYRICDANGYVVCEQDIWSPTDLQEYSHALVIKTDEGSEIFSVNENGEIFYELTLSDEKTEPYIANNTEIYGIDRSGHFYYFSLEEGTVLFDIEDITDYEIDGCFIFLRSAFRPYKWMIYDKDKAQLVTYIDSNGEETNEIFDDAPEYSRAENAVYGEASENDDYVCIKYDIMSGKCERLTLEDDDDSDELNENKNNFLDTVIKNNIHNFVSNIVENYKSDSKTSKKKVLTESINNTDAPLYHNTCMENLLNMMKTNSIKSNYHRGYNSNGTQNGICFTRNKNFSPYNYYDVLMKFDIDKLQKYTRGLKLIPYQDDTWAGLDEMEERLISKNGKNFEITNLNKIVSEVVIRLDRTCSDAIENGYDTDVIIDELKNVVANNIFDNLKIVEGQTTEESMNLSQAIEYLSEQLEDKDYEGKTHQLYVVEYYDESYNNWVEEEYTHIRQEALDTARDMYEQNQIPTRVAYGNYNGYEFNCESIVEEFGEELEKEIW